MAHDSDPFDLVPDFPIDDPSFLPMPCISSLWYPYQRDLKPLSVLTPEYAQEEAEDLNYPSGGTAKSLEVIDVDAQDDGGTVVCNFTFSVISSADEGTARGTKASQRTEGEPNCTSNTAPQGHHMPLVMSGRGGAYLISPGSIADPSRGDINSDTRDRFPQYWELTDQLKPWAHVLCMQNL